MTPQTLLDNVRAQAVETSAAFWTDEELRLYLWQGLQELCNEFDLIQSTDDSTTTVASTQEYSKPSGILKIHRVTWDGVKVKKIDLTQYDAVRQTGYGGTVADGNVVYYYEWGDVIGFYPIPSEAKTVKIWFTKEPTQITSGDMDSTTIIEIPERYQWFLQDYILYRMYMKDQDSRGSMHFDLWSQHKDRIRETWYERNFDDQYVVVKDEENMNESDLGII